MDIILTILGLATLGVTLQQTKWYEIGPFNRKPFNCTLCLTTWASFIYLCFTANPPFLSIVFMSTIAGVLAEYLDQQINPFK